MIKKCYKCRELKDIADFGRDRRRKDLLNVNCRLCINSYYTKMSKEEKEVLNHKKKNYYYKNRDRLLKSKVDKYKDYEYKDFRKDARLKSYFGINLDIYKTMLSEQNNVCAICRQSCKTGRDLAVDHCHSTGKVRGLLCCKCNNGVGSFNDNIEIMKRAIKYIDGVKTKLND